MRKRIISGLLAAAMALSLTACGGNSSEAGNSGADNSGSGSEATEINICMPNIYDISQLDQIQEKVNEITTEKYGLKAKLTYVDFGNWAQQSTALLTSDEADLIMVYGTPLLTYVKNGQLYDMTDLYANANDDFVSAIKDLIPEDVVNTCRIDGKLYALPNVRNQGDAIMLQMDSKIAEEYGVTPGDDWSLDDVDTFLAWCKENYPDRYGIVPQGNTMMSNAGWTYDGLGDIDLVGVIGIDGEDTTVHSLYEDDGFLDLTSHTDYWYQQGYMMADALSNTETGSAMIANGKAVSCMNNGQYLKEDVKGLTANGLTSVFICPAFASTTTITGLCWGINANSKNPEKAFEMMELLYYDKDVATLLLNGIEGQNYVVNEDGTASFPEGTDATNCGYGAMEEQWLFPNMTLGYPIDYRGTDGSELMKKFNSSIQHSAGFGFVFDTSNVIDEYTACCAVYDKYYAALMLGATGDYEATLEAAKQAMKDAGEDVVIAEKQKQFDEWLAAQK